MRRLLILVLLLCCSLAHAAEGPKQYTPLISQGETFNRIISVVDRYAAPIDFTGYSAKLRIRNSATKLQLLELTNGAGLTFGGSGIITWTMTSAQTATLPVGVSSVYDLKVTSSGGAVSYLIYGYLNVKERVTP